MEWYSKNNAMPADDWRIITFSPVYPKGHEMRIRVMQGQFVKYCSDVTHWAIPNEPSDTPQDKSCSIDP